MERSANHGTACVAGRLREAAAEVGVELSVAYSQAIAADGLARGPELAVTRLGAGVVFHARPGRDERLPVVLGYADSRGQWYRDGRRHVEVAAGLPEDVSGGVAL
jgi:hypothetical protein